MKNTLKTRALGSVLLAVLLLYACKDSFLDVKPTGTLNEDLLATPQGIEA
jgi:hypothetical protein